MFLNKEYIGLALDGNYIRMAHIKKKGNTIQLLKLDRFELAERIHTSQDEPQATASGGGSQPAESAQNESDSGDVFGFEDTEDEPVRTEQNDSDNVDFDDLEAEAARKEDDDLASLDMVSEAGGGDIQSNPVLLYDIIMGVDTKSVDLAFNILAGEAIFQIIDDTDFNEVKTKNLVEDLEVKLESIYGESKSTDNYAYEIREDGSLVLASVEQQAALLEVANETDDIYNGKIKIDAIYPDEVILAGLLKEHYQLEAGEITAIIQFSPNRSRILFMDGEEIFEVLPVIEQGTEDANFLSTIFSKLLFQLDTDNVPSPDQIIIANNTIGDEAVDFFKQNFSNATVQNFTFNQEKLHVGSYQPETVNAFTTAIGTAWSAVDSDDKMPTLSFLPDYVVERQKIFKLRWHGLILLILIFLSIPSINYFYQQNAGKIDEFSSELEVTKGRISEVEPVVKQTNEISQNLSLLTSKLSLLDSLSTGSKTWSTKLDILNEGMNRVPNSWLTSLSKTKDGIFLEGYTLYRNRVPAIIDLFAQATLLNVTMDEVRGEQMFNFSMIVQKFTRDSTLYSPEKSEKIDQLLSK